MSSRVHDRAPAEAVGSALDMIPDRLHPLVACEFIIGADPGFSGVHSYDCGSWGIPYRELAHCVYSFHQTHRPVGDRTTKVVLPSNPAYGWGTRSGPLVVVHELGHVLHERVGFDWTAEPVSGYARTNSLEAFAEAFEAWIQGEPVDASTDALLEGLSA